MCLRVTRTGKQKGMDMADYEIDDSSTNYDTYGGLDPNEVKEWSLRDFMDAMMRSNAVAIIKFWSLISQLPDDKLRDGAKEWIGGITKHGRRNFWPTFGRLMPTLGSTRI